MIDPKILATISKLSPPHNKMSVQLVMGKINFLWRFVPIFLKMVKPLQDMVKQKKKYKWETKQKVAFTSIMEAIARAPSLMSLDFSKEFLLYTFASDTSYATILTQRNQVGDEVLRSFMSTRLGETQLKYLEVDKQAFAVFKEVKHFRPYLLKSQTKVIVPYSAVRNLFV